MTAIGDTSVVALFAAQARRRPDATAMRWAGRAMSYADLDRHSNAIAHRLLAGGLEREEIVPLLVDRSFAYVVAVLGVLKAGGSYLPLDLDAPPRRIRSLLEDCRARKIVTTPEFQPRVLGWCGETLALDETGETCGDFPCPAIAIDPSQRAYLIYTSGSTGRQKAVEIEHHSLGNLVHHYQTSLGLTERDRSTLLAFTTFDASVADLWPCLCVGGTLLIPPLEILTDMDALIAWLAEEGATFTFVSTAYAEMMFARPWPSRPTLRYLATGGDTLYARPPAGLPFTVLNTYGPTENTVDSTWSRVAPAPAAGRPAIGRPITNVQAYVLDENRELLPQGREGELYLGGEQVARGYLNQPELTRERFLPDPFANTTGARMYRTGDRAVWNADGELEFLGRVDHQIQIRGKRVELGEIEAALRAHELVAEACCVPLEEDHSIRGVIAHVATRTPSDDAASRLQTDLAAELPAYMVPRAIVIHESLPRNAAGKVDRNALRENAGTVPTPSPAPGTCESTAEQVQRIWRQFFPKANCADPEETFWTLGGDSLMAVQLMLAVLNQIGHRVPVSSFLLQPTLAGLCTTVERLYAQSVSPLLALRATGNRRPLFCLYDIHGDVGTYFHLAEALGGDQPVYGIRSPALHDLPAAPDSIEAAAAQVVAEIRRATSDPTPALVGYSWAGLVAFEAARQWIRAGNDQPFVGMIGTPSPLRRITPAVRLGHFLRWSPHWLHRSLVERHNWRRRARRFGAVARGLAGLLAPGTDAPPEAPEWAADPLVKHHVTLGHRYQPDIEQPIVVDLIRERPEFREAGHPFEPQDLNHHWDNNWTAWAKQPAQVHWMDSGHLDIMHPPHVFELAIRLRSAIDEYYTLLPWTPRPAPPSQSL